MTNDDRNQYQIIRKDARNCFVEVKSDSFQIGKMHLEFATYDVNRPAGQRQTNYVSIYIDISEFLHLVHFVLYGGCHSQMMACKKNEEMAKQPLYQSLGGTSAQRLAQYGRARKDGMSLSRSVKLFAGKKADYLFYAASGAGETDAKGLIVPRYGNNPEQKVTVSLSMAHLNELMLAAMSHYNAWLSGWYARNYQSPKQKNGNAYVPENGRDNADDTEMF